MTNVYKIKNIEDGIKNIRDRIENIEDVRNSLITLAGAPFSPYLRTLPDTTPKGTLRL
jgi:hypothetical protein